MRKVNPNDVRADFETEVGAIIMHFERITNALSGSQNEMSDISRLAMQSFMAVFVAFERFLSDIFLAYLNRDFSVYQANLNMRLRNSIEKNFGHQALSLVTIRTRVHVTLAEVEAFVDYQGRNLTFSKTEKIKECANDWLAQPHATRICSITASETRLIETARSIRDFIAHQSTFAKARMNSQLATINTGNHYPRLARGVKEINSVGAYLKAVDGGERRLHRYASALLQVAAHI